MLLPFDLLRLEDHAVIDVVEVAAEVGAGALVLISNRVLLAIVILKYAVVLTCRLDLRLLLNSEVVLVIELCWQEAKFIRGVQARRHQIQEIQIILQKVLLVRKPSHFAYIAFVTIQVLKHVVFIQKAIVDHVWVHDV